MKRVITARLIPGLSTGLTFRAGKGWELDVESAVICGGTRPAVGVGTVGGP